MSSRNKARKSTGPRVPPTSSVQASQRRGSSNQNNSTVHSQNSTVPLRFQSSSSSDSDVPTQRLRPRNQNSQANSPGIPGPSGHSSQATSYGHISTDSDCEVSSSTQRPARRRIQREQSSSDTTSDSDAPGHRSILENRKTTEKRKKTKASPKGKQKPTRSRKNKTSESEDEPRTRPSSSSSQLQSRNTSSLPSSSNSQFQSRNLSSLVNKCVYFLLIADQKKYAIKRHEILKHVFCNQDNKVYNAVIEEANNVLKKVYGLEIIINEKKKGEYLLINYLDRDLSVQEFMEQSIAELQKRSFIFYLLTVIFMNENTISEEELATALKPLGIDFHSRIPHPVFGDVKKYLTGELVKQMYLEHRCISKDPPQNEFSWGIRAKQEVDKKDLLEFASQIMSDTKPEDWILQFKDAEDSAKQRKSKSDRSRAKNN